MVTRPNLTHGAIVCFQYSLCRVVLMVPFAQLLDDHIVALSVLALSSRFDGRVAESVSHHHISLSVLALSSRFDGRSCSMSFSKSL